MNPKITLMEKIDEGKTNGGYIYGDGLQDDCEIIISKDSQNPSRTLIHECIHHTIREMKKDKKLEKIAHRIFRREDFITTLAENLSKTLKFKITPLEK